MTASAEHRAAARPSAAGRRGPRTAGLIGLLAALAAGGALLVLSPADDPVPVPAGRVSVASAWPQAQRADIPANLADGPVYNPGIFLDARTSVGTAPTPEATQLRLLVRDGGGAVRELRRLPMDGNPQFDNFAIGGDELVWMESTEKSRTRLWAANLRTGAPARRLTTDTGNAVFYGSQYDLVLADGRVYWTAGGTGGRPSTQIRSVALTGGPVRVRTEPGTWALTAWPWLVDGVAERSGATRLRNLATQRDSIVESSGVELTSCSPAWCRVMVMSGDGLARIDLMHPDGTARQRIAGSEAGAAITDVAPLDRFEVLSEAGPNSDVTGTAQLLLYEIAAKRTVEVGVDVGGAFYRAGVLWWSTGDQDDLIWHTLDLRTV